MKPIYVSDSPVNQTFELTSKLFDVLLGLVGSLGLFSKTRWNIPPYKEHSIVNYMPTCERCVPAGWGCSSLEVVSWVGIAS